jgi:hypothetical protein
MIIYPAYLCRGDKEIIWLAWSPCLSFTLSKDAKGVIVAKYCVKPGISLHPYLPGSLLRTGK